MRTGVGVGVRVSIWLLGCVGRGDLWSKKNILRSLEKVKDGERYIR